MHAVAPLIDESSGESPLTVEYPGNGVVRFNAAIRVAIKRYNHAVTWATRHFISLISISKKYESNFMKISQLHLLVVIYECTSDQRKHRVGVETSKSFFRKKAKNKSKRSKCCGLAISRRIQIYAMIGVELRTRRDFRPIVKTHICIRLL